MAGIYSVRTVIAANGERLPILRNRETGTPEFDPLVYVLTKYRQANRASATIERILREIEVLLVFLDQSKIDLTQRLQEGCTLTLQEIDALARHCALPASEFGSQHLPRENVIPLRKSVIAKTERVRMRSSTARGDQLSPVTVSNRIRSIHDYLAWKVDTYLSSHRGVDDTMRLSILATKEQMLGWINEAMPSAKGRNVVGTREGLDPDVLDRLLSVIEPTSSENPWATEHSRKRNSLMTCWLAMLGIRRGEALGVKISDIDLRKEQVLIARRADDPDDRRKKKPNTKTRDRVLPLKPELAAATHEYITKIRSKIKGARRNEFLFVADGTGSPLTLDAANKVYRVLRQRVVDMPNDISPHILRHTWNDLFSETMDRNGIGENEEQKMRSFLMGWSDTSKSAQTYTKRTVRKRAQKASLEMQQKMMESKSEK